MDPINWPDAPYSERVFMAELATVQHLFAAYQDAGLQLVLSPAKNLYLPGYMYRAVRNFPTPLPRLLIDGAIWMSITPQETESQWLPIRMARGVVGVGGLGMGYVVDRMLQQPKVRRVDVWEQDQRVIDLYHATRHRMDPRLHIIHGDLRSECVGRTYDLFYNDIYPHLLNDGAVTDMVHLQLSNDIAVYHWWTMEALVLEFECAGQPNLLPRWWRKQCHPLMERFRRSPQYATRFITGTAPEWYEELVQARIIKPKPDMRMQLINGLRHYLDHCEAEGVWRFSDEMREEVSGQSTQQALKESARQGGMLPAHL